MGTARELLYDTVYGDDAVLYKDYLQASRPIRGYPNFFRLRDDVSFVDGPQNFGQRYLPEDIIWRAEVLGDKRTIYVVREDNSPFSLTYVHNADVDNVSLEFDQNGRLMFAFESEGRIFLRWFDPIPADTVTFEIGEGITPRLATDNYNRTTGAAGSERFLFYIREGNLYARRQSDRYTIEYLCYDFSGNAVELLEARPTLYGNFCAVVAERAALGVRATSVSTEDIQPSFLSRASIDIDSISIDSVALRDVTPVIRGTDRAGIDIDSINVNTVSVVNKAVIVSSETDKASIFLDSLSVNDVALRNVFVDVSSETDNASIYIDSLSSTTPVIKPALVLIEREDNASIYLESLTINNVTVGTDD